MIQIRRHSALRVRLGQEAHVNAKEVITQHIHFGFLIGLRVIQTIKINQGLLALGNVINALADDERLAKEKKVHVPGVSNALDCPLIIQRSW